jgi:hypothetical protein
VWWYVLAFFADATIDEFHKPLKFGTSSIRCGITGIDSPSMKDFIRSGTVR